MLALLLHPSDGDEVILFHHLKGPILPGESFRNLINFKCITILLLSLNNLILYGPIFVDDCARRNFVATDSTNIRLVLFRWYRSE